jgi:translation initiation factor 3 subunit F
MAVTLEAESFLHLARPLAPVTVGVQPTTAPLTVIIQPQVCPVVFHALS